MPKKHVSYIVQFVKEHPDLKKFYKRTFGADEMFLETILMNSPFKSSVSNESMRYVDFSEGKKHPRNLTRDDLENLKKSGKLFARKFKRAAHSDGMLFQFSHGQPQN